MTQLRPILDVAQDLGLDPQDVILWGRNKAKISLDALARRDVDGARQVIGADKAIDAAFNAILRQLVTYMMEEPRTIGEALDIIWIAKALERVGDHATNIAENVIYIVSGVDVRHTGTATHQATKKT